MTSGPRRSRQLRPPSRRPRRDVRMRPRRRPVRRLRPRPSPTTASLRAPRTVPCPRGGGRRGRPDARRRTLHDRLDAARHRPAQRPDRAARQPDGDLASAARSATTAGSSPAVSTACRRWPAAIPRPSASSARARTASTRRRWTCGNVDPTPLTAAIQVTTGTACAAPTVGSDPRPWCRRQPARSLFIPYDDKGAGGRLHVEYGPTTAYGMEVSETRASRTGPRRNRRWRRKRTVGPVPPSTPGHAHPLQGDDHDPLRDREHAATRP